MTTIAHVSIIKKDGSIGERMAMDEQEYLFGRSAHVSLCLPPGHFLLRETAVRRQTHCDIRVNLSTVSREHCKVAFDASTKKVRNNSSVQHRAVSAHCIVHACILYMPHVLYALTYLCMAVHAVCIPGTARGGRLRASLPPHIG